MIGKLLLGAALIGALLLLVASPVHELAWLEVDVAVGFVGALIT